MSRNQWGNPNKWGSYSEGGGGGDTSDYEDLENLPSINGETIVGNKEGRDYGLLDSDKLFVNLGYPEFNTSVSYDIGDIVTYNGGLYKFVTSHEGVWDSSDVTSVSLESIIPDPIPVVDASTIPASMDADKVYQYGTLSGDTTFPALATPSDLTVAHVYCWTFATPATAPTITWPVAITAWAGGSAPTINASKKYEVSVMDGLATIIEA